MAENRTLLRATGITFVLLLVCSGCVGVLDHQNGQSPAGSVDLATSSLSSNESGFWFAGKIHYSAPAGTQLPADNVMICLYGENRQFKGKNIGSVSSSEPDRRFEISATSRPKYVIVYHPNFADDHNRAALAWDSEQEYYVTTWTRELDVPYPENGTAGTCPSY